MTSIAFQNIEAPKDIELFRHMTRLEIEVILGSVKARRFSYRTVITQQGEPADQLFLLWKGRARYFFEMPTGKKLILHWLTPGQVFGVAALLSAPATYLVSTEAVQDSVALLWSGEAIRSLARRFPRLLENALAIATDYMSWYVAAHAGLTSQSARQRLAHVLAVMADCIGQKVPTGTEFDVTNEDLASAANITPFTASRMISRWQKIGAIDKRRGKVILRSPKQLFRHS
jgi:CRP-like cAMP-binding protein